VTCIDYLGLLPSILNKSGKHGHFWSFSSTNWVDPLTDIFPSKLYEWIRICFISRVILLLDLEGLKIIVKRLLILGK